MGGELASVGMLLMRGEVSVNEMLTRKAEVAAIAVAVEGLGGGWLGLLLGAGVLPMGGQGADGFEFKSVAILGVEQWSATLGPGTAQEGEFSSFTTGPHAPKSSRGATGGADDEATGVQGRLHDLLQGEDYQEALRGKLPDDDTAVRRSGYPHGCRAHNLHADARMCVRRQFQQRELEACLLRVHRSIGQGLRGLRECATSGEQGLVASRWQPAARRRRWAVELTDVTPNPH